MACDLTQGVHLMTKFIELRRVGPGQSVFGQSVFVNPQHVVRVDAGTPEGASMVYMVDGEHALIQGNPADVVKKLCE
jgi:hypothetical protein